MKIFQAISLIPVIVDNLGSISIVFWGHIYIYYFLE